MICLYKEIKGKKTKFYYCSVFDKAVDDKKCAICSIRKKYENEKVKRLFKIMFGGWYKEK